MSITSGIHYQRLNEVLLALISRLSSKCTYYLLVDELDEGYKHEDNSGRLLILSLLRSLEECFFALKDTGINFIPITALRSDIFDRLDDNDVNKLDDYILRLNWLADSGETYSLRDIVNARIKASFPAESRDDCWDLITYDTDPNLPWQVESLWRYVYTRTFERPRDVIKFMKNCKKVCKKDILEFDEVKKAEDWYSDWFYKELGNEIHPYLSVWRDVLQCISRIGKTAFWSSELKTAFLADPKVKSYMDNNNSSPLEIIEILYTFGVIGNLYEDGRWLFRYKDMDLPWNDNMKIIVHFGFVQKLRLRYK